MEVENKSYFVHTTMCGMYLAHILLTDWCKGLYEINKLVFGFMGWMMFVCLIGIPFGIIYSDFTGYWMAILMNVGMVALVYVGTPYNGLVKKMGLLHGLIMTIGVVYVILRISTGFDCDSSFFCEQITYDNKPGLFIYLIIFVITYGYCGIQDFIDVYVWFVKGNHIVTRSMKTVNELKKRGLLTENVGQIQVIQIAHNRANNINKYGYIIADQQQQKSAEV